MNTSKDLKNQFNTNLDTFNEVGYVEIVSHPIVYLEGLPKAKPSELILFESGEFGEVQSVNNNHVEVLVFSEIPLLVGTKASRTDKVLQIPVGDHLLGASINPLGHSIYPNKPLAKSENYRNINTSPTGIDTRVKIAQPLETGVSLVDLMIPLGKGQRELIIGDRKIGKTAFILQTILSQVNQGSLCIYAGIGKKQIDIKKVENFLEKQNIKDKTIIIASRASDSLGLIHITPYAAMTLAEYFRDKGQDVLLILDDLSTHAKFYREVSLIAKRFPGRNSYPGDIFYAHARLLERAGNFKHENGSVSITCLPVAETVEGDISGFIQTNLMSITDGHVFFDKDLFTQGRRPAINYFLSVTRVGRQTQTPLRWGINRELSSFLTLYEKTQSFVHFGAELNQGITTTLNMGDKLLAFFGQHMNRVLPLNLQITLYTLIWLGIWSADGKSKMRSDLERVIKAYEENSSYKQEVDALITSAKDFNDFLGKCAPKMDFLLGRSS
ncbi:MAG: F0F1 ATP synthase subunit alpha [Patescibacteria group bacterium]